MEQPYTKKLFASLDGKLASLPVPTCSERYKGEFRTPHGNPRSIDVLIAPGTDVHRYEAVLRVSDASSACRESKKLARILAEQLQEFTEPHTDFPHSRCQPTTEGPTTGRRDDW